MDARASKPRPHIAAVVINSVAHDARVLKEADGLAAAGYRVTIYGIQDARCAEAVTVRSSGVVIRRADQRSRAVVMRARMTAGLLALVMLAAVGVIVAVVAGHGSHPVIGTLVVATMLVVLAGFARQFRRQVATARKAAAAAGTVRPTASPTIAEVKPAAPARPAAAKPTATPASLTTGPTTGPAGRIAKLRAAVRSWIAHRLRSKALVDLILSDAPDAVHAHDLYALPIGWAVKRRLGCPLVFDSHELHDDLSQISAFTRRRSERWHRYYSTRLDGFITVNDSIAATLRDRYPHLPEAVIIRNATRFDGEVVADDGRLHRAAKLDPSTQILLYQGGFARHRGLDVLIRSAPLLPEGWALVMMGWGTFEPTLRGIAAQVDPSGERVRFLPGAPQAELAQWTAGASLGVIPYENVCLNHWFCTPNKIWEYPVAGVPILASPFPELRKAVEGNGTGVLLEDPVTPENIARAVAGVSGERLAEMRRACRAFLAKDNWSLYERRLVELYRRLLRNPGVAADEAVPSEAAHAGEPVAVPSDR